MALSKHFAQTNNFLSRFHSQCSFKVNKGSLKGNMSFPGTSLVCLAPSNHFLQPSALGLRPASIPSSDEAIKQAAKYRSLLL